MIRNFLYLDSDKLRSISSQLFEGVTEKILATEHETRESTETQKGPIASGQILAEIFAKERTTSELRFMEDHAYTIFENRLAEMSMLCDIELSAPHFPIAQQFIKVTGRLRFNDLTASASMLKNFNEMGEAFWRVTNESMMPADGGKIASDGEAKKLAAQSGLQMHKKVVDAAALLIDLGFRNLFEAHISLDGQLVSAPLKREFLRDSEEMLIQKYSRSTFRSFTIVGIITQQGQVQNEDDPPADVKDAADMKQAMRNLSMQLGIFERAFVGASPNEIIVDPIAIYCDLLK